MGYYYQDLISMRALYLRKNDINVKRGQMIFCVLCEILCVRGNRCPCCKIPQKDADYELIPAGSVPLAA